MNIEIEALVTPKITKHCIPLYLDGHYKDAARESMVQVELALKQKVPGTEHLFGHNLVKTLFEVGGERKQVRLWVPLGDDLQDKAKILFDGAFTYYRNYSAHDGSKIGQQQSLRIMILASELLDLIDASSLSFEDIGGVEGLLKSGVFKSEGQLLGLLTLLDGYSIIEWGPAPLNDDMCSLEAEELHLSALMDLDLVRYEESKCYPDPEDHFDFGETLIGWYTLTELGKQFVNELQRRKGRG